MRRRNPLQLAAFNGSDERTISLLSSGRVGVDINQGTTEGWTPLMISANEGHTHVVRILLRKGADITLADTDGFTALHFYGDNGHQAVTKLLIKAGAEWRQRPAPQVTRHCTWPRSMGIR